MKDLINQIFRHQEKLIGREWAESRKKAFQEVQKMKERQLKLTPEEAKKQAFEQAEKIKRERAQAQEKKNESQRKNFRND